MGAVGGAEDRQHCSDFLAGQDSPAPLDRDGKMESGNLGGDVPARCSPFQDRTYIANSGTSGMLGTVSISQHLEVLGFQGHQRSTQKRFEDHFHGPLRFGPSLQPCPAASRKGPEAQTGFLTDLGCGTYHPITAPVGVGSAPSCLTRV